MAVEGVSDIGPAAVPAVLRRYGTVGWLLVGVFLGVMAILVGYRAMSGLIVPIGAALVLAVMTLPTDQLAGPLHAPRRSRSPSSCSWCAAAVVALAVVFTKGVAEQVPAIQAVDPAGHRQDRGRPRDHERQQRDGLDRLRPAPAPPASSPGSRASPASWCPASTRWSPCSSGCSSRRWCFFLVLLNPQGEPRAGSLGCCPGRGSRPTGSSRRPGRSSSTTTRAARSWPASTRFPIWMVALVLDIKAAGAIFVVLFVSSYIPYIGAWIGGAFAVIMALGSGGTRTAGSCSAAVLVVNLGLQSVVQPFAFGATMKVSPLGVFLFTLLGGMVAGVFGAMMAAPVMALITRFNTDVRLPGPEAADIVPGRRGPATCARVRGGCCRAARGRRVARDRAGDGGARELRGR